MTRLQTFRILILASLATANIFAELSSLRVTKEAVRHYYENGGYEADLKNIVSSVRALFMHPAQHAKQVVIFDVDETALSIYQWYKENDFGISYAVYCYVLREQKLPATPQIKELYEHFRSLGYAIIFLTARSEHLYEKTRNNLITEGYTTFEHLITRSKEEAHLPLGVFKESVRCRLVQQGYEIVCCIDDNHKALQGLHVGHPVKIPNYLY